MSFERTNPNGNVWLRFDGDEEMAEAEANIFKADGGFSDYVVDWYLTAVGLVKSVWFDTYAEAEAWLQEQGYQDFSPGE